jgi:UDP-glucose 4-epimerase
MASEHPDVVFHLAAQMDVRRSVREPEFDAETNIVGSLRVMLAAIGHRVRRIVYASSGGAAYGDVKRLPVSEADVPSPISEYGASKLAVEHYLSVYHARGTLETVALRLPNVFGPRQRPDGEAGVISIFAGRMLRGEECVIYGDGSKTRDYVYVSDVVRAFVLGLAAKSGSVLNIGTGSGGGEGGLFTAASHAPVPRRGGQGHRAGRVGGPERDWLASDGSI